jgi:AcrR family transcriptional regulator
MRLPDATNDETAPAVAGAETREALLAAAAEVFADKGFQDATVRDICQRANANIAAVNYHFGGKEELYSEVLLGLKNAGAPPDHLKLGSEVPAEFRLEAYVRWLLQRLVAEGIEGRHGQIMSREMIHPTAALGRVVEEFMRPQAQWLEVLVRELLGPGFSSTEYRLAVMSVVGQILFYKHCRPVLERLGQGMVPVPGQIGGHVRHIVDFSLAGFRGMREARGGTAKASHKIVD